MKKRHQLWFVLAHILYLSAVCLRCMFLTGRIRAPHCSNTCKTTSTRKIATSLAADGNNNDNKFNLHRASDHSDTFNSTDTETYGRRSKRWTQQYRTLIPYSEVCVYALFRDDCSLWPSMKSQQFDAGAF